MQNGSKMFPGSVLYIERTYIIYAHTNGSNLRFTTESSSRGARRAEQSVHHGEPPPALRRSTTHDSNQSRVLQHVWPLSPARLCIPVVYDARKGVPDGLHNQYRKLYKDVQDVFKELPRRWQWLGRVLDGLLRDLFLARLRDNAQGNSQSRYPEGLFSWFL